ncbi:MAG: cation transporter [Acidobacteriota bacterium]|nr:MAG: cation transporter [Acidobacteriota bacterium]
MYKESGEKVFLGGAVVAAVAASLCCILPVVAIAFGLGAFGIASVFESLRPYMLVVVTAALAFSFYRIYFRREECGEGQACSTKPMGRFNQIALWVATVAVVGIAAFPYYSGAIISALDRQQPQVAEPNQMVIAGENKTYNLDTQNSEETAFSESEVQTLKTLVIAVEGMTCEGCASHINIALKRIKGVISAEANYREKNVKVVYNPKLVVVERIKQGIRDAGYNPQ